MSHLHSNSTITPINIEVNGPKRTTIFPSEGGQNVQCDSSTPRPSFLPTGAVAGCRGPRRTYSANVVQEAVRRGVGFGWEVGEFQGLSWSIKLSSKKKSTHLFGKFLEGKHVLFGNCPALQPI